VYIYSKDNYGAHYLDVPKILSGYKNRNEIYLATEQGLYVYEEDNGARKYSENVGALNDKIVEIKSFRDGILIGSYVNGLLLLRNDSLYSLGKKQGLISSNISCIEVENDHFVWVGTYQGLEKVEIGSDLS